uniref:Uncharacterized protein n=1 Tax=Tanacetum cinerariifolium TaxID=118510 RepID=A0A699JRJ0_TANCI|nr:hypothetical protein [Tanacetum cinerariifolium]
MDLCIDLRFLLLPLVYVRFLFTPYTSTIFTVFLLIVSIKVPLRLQLSTGSMFRFQAKDFSVSVMACFLCFTFMSTTHFLIATLILALCLSPWDDFLFKLLKLCFLWLYHTLKAAPIVDILCIFNHRQREDEAIIDQHDELSDSNELYDLEAQVDVELNSEPYDERTPVDEELSSESYDEES